MRRFTENELEVMKILWVEGEMKPREIQSRFPREIKNPALRSYLTILLEKGHISRKWKDGAYYYRARTKRESVLREMYGRLLDSFFGGSPESLLCHLIKDEQISEERLLELKEISEGKRKQDETSLEGEDS